MLKRSGDDNAELALEHRYHDHAEDTLFSDPAIDDVVHAQKDVLPRASGKLNVMGLSVSNYMDWTAASILTDCNQRSNPSIDRQLPEWPGAQRRRWRQSRRSFVGSISTTCLHPRRDQAGLQP